MEPIGIVPLSHAVISKDRQDDKEHKYCLKIRPKDVVPPTFFVCADTQEDYDEWYRVLVEASQLTNSLWNNEHNLSSSPTAAMHRHAPGSNNSGICEECSQENNPAKLAYAPSHRFSSSPKTPKT